ncbi:hypothetical protein Z045_05655 [Rhodococcus pyridinivorans KG-16]|uniref:Uncharacterized protein n=1 Tax=Rhodococcus pyridinivorans KG-16 TaxID=1441730 RepID=A0A0V9UNU1_9NOCA|nr:hypothetical protein [Rhodococcus pyridinivorans]KSZ59657.1 hypothetical protein Z045_05655 [Rhodococcus pyridinivorans KG-16]
MPDRESPVKRYELEAVNDAFVRFVEQSAKDRQLDREQAAKDSAEIKSLLKESIKNQREATEKIERDFQKQLDDLKTNYVKKDELTIRLSPHEPIRRFFWWVAGGMGVMFLATLYQLLINGVKTL